MIEQVLSQAHQARERISGIDFVGFSVAEVTFLGISEGAYDAWIIPTRTSGKDDFAIGTSAAETFLITRLKPAAIASAASTLVILSLKALLAITIFNSVFLSFRFSFRPYYYLSFFFLFPRNPISESRSL